MLYEYVPIYTKQIIFEFSFTLRSAYGYIMAIFLSPALKSMSVKFHLGNQTEILKIICISRINLERKCKDRNQQL